MRTRPFPVSRSVAAGLCFAGALALGATGAEAADVYKVQHDSPAGTYQIDPVHSRAQFWVGHLGVSEVPGRFDKISGSFSFDPKHPDAAKVSVEVPVDSLDTDFAQRNKDLLGPDFFDAKQFPTISFVSTRLRWHGGNEASLTGNLTLHGVTHPVTFRLRHIGAGPDPWGSYRSGYVATGTIRRSDFGMTYLLKGVGDEVHLRISLEGKRPK